MANSANKLRKEKAFSAQVISLCLFLLVPFMASTDQAILKSGNVLKGIVGEETETFVDFHLPTGSFKLSREKIKKLVRGSEEENEQYRLEIALRKKRIDDVLLSLKNYQRKKYDSALLPELVAKRSEDVNRMLHSSARSQRVECLELLELLGHFASSDKSAADFCLMLGALNNRFGNYEQASVLYLRAALNSEDESENRAQAIDYFRGRIFLLGRKGVSRKACLELIALEKLAPESAAILGAWFALREAASLRKQNRLASALEIYEQDLSEKFPLVAINRRWFATRSTIRQLLAEKQDEQALLIAEKYLPSIKHSEVRGYMTELFLLGGRKKMAAGKLQEAEDLFFKAEQATATSALKDLQRLEVVASQKRLPVYDAASHLEFAQACLENEYYDIAREVLQKLVEQDGITSRSHELIRMADEQEVMLKYKEASKHYEHHYFHRTMDLIEEIKERFPASHLQLEIGQLERRTARAMSAIPDDPDEEYKLPLTFKEVERAEENIEFYLQENQPKFNKWQLLYKAEIALRDAETFRNRTDYKKSEIEYLRILNKQASSEAAKKLTPKMDGFYTDWVLHELETTMKLPIAFELLTFEDKVLKKELYLLVEELELLK